MLNQVFHLVGTQINLDGELGLTYQWLNPNVDNPTSSSVLVNPDASEVYSVNVSYGVCDIVLKFLVQVSNTEIVIPNAFSPNNDRVNDFFFILPTCPVILEDFKIFNRWGELIFQSNDFE